MITIDKLVEELGMEPDEVAEFISVFLDYTENEDLPALLEGVNSRNPEIVRQRGPFHKRRSAQPDDARDLISGGANGEERRFWKP